MLKKISAKGKLPAEFQDGIYYDMPIEAYHENKSHVSTSGLKYMRQSPKHFLHRYHKDEEERKSHFDFGNAFETMLLDADNADSRICIYDTEAKIKEIQEAKIEKDGKPYEKVKATKAYREWFDSVVKGLNGRYGIDYSGPESLETIKGMLSACYEDAIINKLVKDVSYQCSIFWTHSSGVKLKTRPDIVIPRSNIVIDVKTDIDGSPAGFAKKAAQHDYPIQAIQQIDGLVSSGLMSKVNLYYWLVVTKNEPYCATLYKFTQEDQDWVRGLYEHWISLLAQGQRENRWPGFQQHGNDFGVVDLSLPLWYRSL